MLRKSISRELQKSRVLSSGARALLISFVAFGVASPLVTLFSNAFLWRMSHDVISIGSYNGAWMTGVSVGFVVNGYLLRRVKLSWLYATGLVIQSASCLLLFKVESLQLLEVVALGLIAGLSAGIYWANRNLLSLQMSQGLQRDYFCGLESAQGTLLAVVSPLLFGWFLELGIGQDGKGIIDRYQFLAMLIIAIQIVGAWYIIRTRFEDYEPGSIFVSRPSSLWTKARLFTSIKGIAEGSAVFIPTLIVLRLVGQEQAVGVTQSVAMVLTSVALYFIAGRMGVKNRRRVLQIGVYSMLLGAISLSCMFSQVGALVYLFLQTLAVQLLWVAANPIILDAINADQDNTTKHYSYIVDRELCLNVGRVLGVLVVLGLGGVSDSDLTLRAAPLILAAMTGSLLFVSRDLLKPSRG